MSDEPNQKPPGEPTLKLVVWNKTPEEVREERLGRLAHLIKHTDHKLVCELLDAKAFKRNGIEAFEMYRWDLMFQPWCFCGCDRTWPSRSRFRADLSKDRAFIVSIQSSGHPAAMLFPACKTCAGKYPAKAVEDAHERAAYLASRSRADDVMKLLVNLRGTSGSGKTTVARTFMEKFPHEALFMKNGKPAGVRVDVPGWNWPLFIPGKYSNVCGGMDSIKTQAECADRAIKAYRYGHVLAEGLISSGVGPEGTFPEAITAVAGPNVRFFHLDTPLEVCIARVEGRRAANGNAKPLNPKSTAVKWRSERSSFHKLEAAGLPVHWLPYETAYEKVYRTFAKADAEEDVLAAA